MTEIDRLEELASKPNFLVSRASLRALVRVARAADGLAARLVPELMEICRQWEPDHSSGKDRRTLVLAADAEKELRAALAELLETK